MKRIFAFVSAALVAVGIALTSSFAVAGTAPAGTFVGASDHVTSGGVSIVKTAKGGHVLILDKDFSLDGAPDARVGFGKAGTYAPATDLGPLIKIKGMQAYVIPAVVDASTFDEVYIWCRKFNVPLGVAKLK